MSYQVEIPSSVHRELNRLPSNLQARLLKKISSLRDGPVPPEAIKVSGSMHGYRIRVGDYRIAYLFMNQVVYITEVAHRSEVYKDAIRKLNKAMRKRWKG